MVVDRLRAVINLDNLIHNYKLLKKLNHDKEIFAVVKADAYGHGSVECSLHLEKHGCKYFAVTVLKEAIELRSVGIKSEILIFGKTDPLNASYLSDYNLVQTVDSYEYAFKLSQYGKKIRVHLNIDTGMTRLGIFAQRIEELEKAVSEIKKISELEYIEIAGIYSHFTSAESDKEFTLKQQKLFDELLKRLKAEKINYGLVHLKNSSGLVTLDKNLYDLARCGIAMYGYPPVKTDDEFLPVMSVYAKVIAIKEINKGESVSYGRTFIADKEMTIATIAIGYADGYMRILSNNDFFYFKGYKLPVIGRVCMGLTMINVSGVDIQEGDEVEVFGKNKLLEPMAKRALTITYELLTNMAKPRIDREYIKK
jgi:alanine racemase